MNKRLLLKPRDITELYGISEATQCKLRMNGEFAQFIKRGRSVYVWRDEFETWLRSHTRSSTLEQSND